MKSPVEGAMSRDNKRRKRARKARQAAKRKALLQATTTGARVRRTFVGKARSGDAVEVNLTFSGVPVKVESPEEDLRDKHALQKALFDLVKDQEPS